MTTYKSLSRREILRLAGKAGLASAGAILLGNCKSPTTPDDSEPPPPPPPVEVDVLVKFYNHTQGYLGEKTYTGMSGTLLNIKVSDCPDTSTVDPNRIALRESGRNGWLGRLAGRTESGELTTNLFPSENKEYAAFLMNNTNGADYNIFNTADYYRGLLFHSPDRKWCRWDPIGDGPDWIPREAIRQIKESLIFPWAKYMDFTEIPENDWTNDDLWVGYLLNDSNLRGTFGDFGASVNPQICQTDTMKLRVFIESLIGSLTMCYNLAPKEGVVINYEYISDENGINPIGKDLLAYSIVRDTQYVS